MTVAAQNADDERQSSILSRDSHGAVLVTRTEFSLRYKRLQPIEFLQYNQQAYSRSGHEAKRYLSAMR